MLTSTRGVSHPSRASICLLVAAAGFALCAPAWPASAVEQGAVLNADPHVLEALAAVDALDAAILRQDAPAFEALLAPDMVLHSPANRVSPRRQILQNFHTGAIHYSAYERTVEYAASHGQDVIVMGEEVVRPIGNSSSAGKTLHRRFTDVWVKQQGAWKLTARQATVVAVE